MQLKMSVEHKTNFFKIVIPYSIDKGYPSSMNNTYTQNFYLLNLLTGFAKL